MKYNLLLSAILICTVIFSNPRILAQDTVKQTTPKVFGMGVHILQNQSRIYFDPTDRIVFTISPGKHFRLEPEFGFDFTKDKDTDTKTKTFFYGLGAFGMFQREKANFYGGLRLGYTKNNSEYLNYNTGDPTSSEAMIFSYGPAVGAEYFLGKHFSIGAEVGINITNLNSDGNPSFGDNDYFLIATDAGIILRFYF